MIALATEPPGVPPNATIVSVIVLLALAIAIQRVAARPAHHEPLKQVARTTLAFAIARTILCQLFTNSLEELLADDRWDRDGNPFIPGNMVKAVGVPRMLRLTPPGPQAGPHLPDPGLAKRS